MRRASSNWAGRGRRLGALLGPPVLAAALVGGVANAQSPSGAASATESQDLARSLVRRAKVAYDAERYAEAEKIASELDL